MGILQERENNKSDKDYIEAGLAIYARYGSKNPFNTNLSNDEVRKITSAQLLSLLHNLTNYEHTITYYGPNTIAGFTGDIRKLHHLPKEFIAEPAAKKYIPIPTISNEVYFFDYDMVQSDVT